MLPSGAGGSTSRFQQAVQNYLMDKDKKTMMVLDPTETDVMDEMKIKHEARAKKFQRRFRSLFNNFFGNGLVDTDGWTFLYPLVAQHEPCSRFPPTTLGKGNLHLDAIIVPADMEHTRASFISAKIFFSYDWVLGHPLAILRRPSSIILVKAVEQRMVKFPGNQLELVFHWFARTITSDEWVKDVELPLHHVPHQCYPAILQRDW